MRTPAMTGCSAWSMKAEEALKRIGELYAIEAEIRVRPEAERLAVRQERSQPLLDALYEWISGAVEKIKAGGSVHLRAEPVGRAVLLQW